MLGWIFIIFCFIGLLVSSYGILLHGASFIEKRIGKPFFERLSDGGRKNYWKFILISLPIFFIYKILSRFPIWFVIYYGFTFIGIDTMLVYKFIGFLIFAGAFAKVAEEGKYYFPTDKHSGRYYNNVADAAYNVFYSRRRR